MAGTITGALYLTLPYNFTSDISLYYSTIYPDVYRLYLHIIKKNGEERLIPMNAGFLNITPKSLVLPLDIYIKGSLQQKGIDLFTFEKKFKSVVANSNAFSSGRHTFLKSLNEAFYKLWKYEAVYIETKPVPWCNTCKTNLLRDDIIFKDGTKKIMFIKLKIDNNFFLILKNYEDIAKNIKGVCLNARENFLQLQFGNEKWIIPENLLEEVKNKVGIFITQYSTVKGSAVVNEFSKVPVIVGEGVKTSFLAPSVKSAHFKLLEKTEYLNYVPESEIIYAENVSGSFPACAVCGSVLEYKRVPVVYIKPAMCNFLTIPANASKNFVFPELPISSFKKVLPKMPILTCTNCGKIELGEKEKTCTCGGAMRLNYFFHESIVPLGIYYYLKSVKNFGAMMQYNIRNKAALFMSFSHLRIQFFDKILVLHQPRNVQDSIIQNLDSNVIRLGVAIKRQGIIGEYQFKEARKYIRLIESIRNYAVVHGLKEEPGSLSDNWILSKLEKTKQQYIKLMDQYLFNKAFESVFEFLRNDMSKFYIKLIRGEPLLKPLFYDILVMSYPFLHIKTEEVRKSLNLKNLVFNTGQFSVNEELEYNIEDLRDFIKKGLKLRNDLKIPLRKPIKRLVVVGNERQLNFINQMSDKISKLLNVLKIETFTDWNEMTYIIEPNMDVIGKKYWQWQHHVYNLLISRDPRKVSEALDKGAYDLAVEGQIIKITRDMVNFVLHIPKGFTEIATPFGKANYLVESDEYTENLYFINELVRRIKVMRKDLDVKYDDYVDVTISNVLEIRRVVNAFKDHFSKNILYRKLSFSNEVNESYVVQYRIRGRTFDIGITPLFKDSVILAFTRVPNVTKEYAEELFKAGLGSIYELMQETSSSLMEKSSMNVTTAKKVYTYLKNNPKFAMKESEEKYFCPFCDTEVEANETYCPKCVAPMYRPKKE